MGVGVGGQPFVADHRRAHVRVHERLGPAEGGASQAGGEHHDQVVVRQHDDVLAAEPERHRIAAVVDPPLVPVAFGEGPRGDLCRGGDLHPGGRDESTAVPLAVAQIEVPDLRQVGGPEHQLAPAHGDAVGARRPRVVGDAEGPEQDLGGELRRRLPGDFGQDRRQQ